MFGTMSKRTCYILFLACALGGGVRAAEQGDSQGAETTQPLAAVVAMPAAQIDRGAEVRVRGVVTYLFGDGSACAIQDSSAGLWCTLPGQVSDEARSAIAVGAEIEVTGAMNRGGFSPLLLGSEVRVLGQAELPTPIAGDINRLFAAGDHCQRVELIGRLQGYRKLADAWNMVIEASGRRLVVRMSQAMLDADLGDFIDSKVRIVGVVGDVRNTRGEFLRPALHVGRAEDFRIVEPARSDPFLGEPVPLESIGQFRSQPVYDRRLLTAGVVTLSVPGEFFYLQQGLAGVRMETARLEPLAVGDRIHVAGFLDMERQIGGLTEVVFRRVPDDSAAVGPEPLKMTPTEVLAVNATARRLGRMARPGNYHGCLISFPASLKEVRPPKDGWCQLMLDDGASLQTALLPGSEYERMTGIQVGSRIDVTGVIEISFRAEPGLTAVADPVVTGVDVLLRSAGDIVVVRSPPWWTSPRLLAALTTSAVISIAACAWVFLLRRQVAIQAARLSEEIASRREAAAEYEITLRERARLAANLHDTILQTVTGIGFQLKAGLTHHEASGAGASRLSDHVQFARRMVEHATAQLRGTVWSLKSLPLDGATFRESLAALLERLGDGQEVRVSLEVKEGMQAIPDDVAGSLLLVIQEAVHNALTHAHASLIEVLVDCPPPEGGVRVVIRDDGDGFDPGARGGPGTGHFGVQGMRERMERLGGTLVVTSRPGRGTMVRALIAAAPLMAGRVAGRTGEAERSPA